MVVNVVSKSLGLVLIATAHVVFKGSSQAEVTGILGSNVTLQFTFNDTVIDSNSNVVVYRQPGQRKVAECTKQKGCMGGVVLDIHQNSSVLYHIANLQQNHSGIYMVSLFTGSGLPKQSNTVQLFVQQENSSNTDSPLQTSTVTEDGGSSTSFSHHITILVVSPVLLLAAVLLLLIWCLMRAKDKQHPQQQQQQQQQQQPQHQNSIPTVQATVGGSYSAVPPPSLIYSVLDFAKRPSAALDVDPNDMEYANVTYLQDKRQM